jgi:hypothetical protein
LLSKSSNFSLVDIAVHCLRKEEHIHMFIVMLGFEVSCMEWKCNAMVLICFVYFIHVSINGDANHNWLLFVSDG